MLLKQAVSEYLPVLAGQLDGGCSYQLWSLSPRAKAYEVGAKFSGMWEHTGALPPGWGGYRALLSGSQSSESRP